MATVEFTQADSSNLELVRQIQEDLVCDVGKRSAHSTGGRELCDEDRRLPDDGIDEKLNVQGIREFSGPPCHHRPLKYLNEARVGR